jgi:hypothetical protein
MGYGFRHFSGFFLYILLLYLWIRAFSAVSSRLFRVLDINIFVYTDSRLVRVLHTIFEITWLFQKVDTCQGSVFDTFQARLAMLKGLS